MKTFKAWIKASRLQSQSYIFLPLLLGQIMAMHYFDVWNWSIFLLVQLYGVFIQLYIVYANDYADIETDKLNETFNIFSGGSRVLSNKLLSPKEVRNGAIVMASLTILAGVVGYLLFDRAWLVLLSFVSILLLWMYSYKPVKLSYRGGGEFLQMLGVGMVLPLFGYYSQSGTFDAFPWWLFAVLLPTNLACGMATSLPDEPSDRKSKKRTSSVLFGIKRNMILIILLNTISLSLLIYFSLTSSLIDFSYILIFPIIAILLQFPFINAIPGSKKLGNYVALAVTFTLFITVVMGISYY
jgi:1,4-dihydroxy-2-naphthoate octaprenyltransferase